jgi:glycosyltransferase involved in cell wall biosynthesis
MKESSGDWICFLDADDEYFSYTLEIMNQMIEKNPKYKFLTEPVIMFGLTGLVTLGNI